MNENLLARRIELFDRMVRGGMLHLVAKDLAKRNPLFKGVSPGAIMRDWGRRKRWIHLIVRSDDETILDQTLGAIRQVGLEAWRVYANTMNMNAKVGALRVILETHVKLIDILQNIGAIKREPSETRVTLSSTPFDADPEMKRLLLEEAAKQRAEKSAAKQV